MSSNQPMNELIPLAPYSKGQAPPKLEDIFGNVNPNTENKGGKRKTSKRRSRKKSLSRKSGKKKPTEEKKRASSASYGKRPIPGSDPNTVQILDTLIARRRKRKSRKKVSRKSRAKSRPKSRAKSRPKSRAKSTSKLINKSTKNVESVTQHSYGLNKNTFNIPTDIILARRKKKKGSRKKSSRKKNVSRKKRGSKKKSRRKKSKKPVTKNRYSNMINNTFSYIDNI